MGTRADFYIRAKNNKLTWLGSCTHDGYDVATLETCAPAKRLAESKTVYSFKRNLSDYASYKIREGGEWIWADEGWPWPWDDSNLTDYSYIYDARNKKIECYNLDKGLIAWPDMSSIRNVTHAGFMILKFL